MESPRQRNTTQHNTKFKLENEIINDLLLFSLLCSNVKVSNNFKVSNNNLSQPQKEKQI